MVDQICGSLLTINMTRLSFTFSSGVVDYFFDAEFEHLEKLAGRENTIILTDKNVFSKHKKKFSGWKAGG